MRCNATPGIGMQERRLIALQGAPKSATVEQSSARSHLGQLWNDTKRYHLRTDGTLELAGSVPMAAGAAIGKIGNAVVGDISNALGAKTRPVPLGEGNLKYMRRDVASLADNALDFGKNVITLHPVRALGNVVKGGFDALDLTFVDPILDGGTALFGHAYERRGGSVFSQNMETRERISQLQRNAAVNETPFSNN